MYYLPIEALHAWQLKWWEGLSKILVQGCKQRYLQGPAGHTCRVQQDTNVWIGQGWLIPCRLIPWVTDQEWQALGELKIHTHPEAFSSLYSIVLMRLTARDLGLITSFKDWGVGRTSKQNYNSILKEANKASPILIWSLPSVPVLDSIPLLLLCPPVTWPPYLLHNPMPLPFHFRCHLFFCLKCSSNMPLSIFKAHLKCLFLLSLWLIHMLLQHLALFTRAWVIIMTKWHIG